MEQRQDHVQKMSQLSVIKTLTNTSCERNLSHAVHQGKNKKTIDFLCKIIYLLIYKYECLQ